MSELMPMGTLSSINSSLDQPQVGQTFAVLLTLLENLVIVDYPRQQLACGHGWRSFRCKESIVIFEDCIAII